MSDLSARSAQETGVPIEPPHSAVIDGYHPQLNALRLVAVGLVLAEHWLHSIVARTGLEGSYGVWLFFVISGYLITTILLAYRDKVQSGQTSVGQALRVFYARRVLRIFPAYYMFLLIAAFAGRLTWDNGLWHVAYLSNVYFIRLGHFETLGHLWSLAVEEQFYLFWPLLIIVLPRRSLGWLMTVGVVGAVVYRAASLAAGEPIAAYAALLGCLDTLGAGSLLAWFRYRKAAEPAAAMVGTGLIALLAVPALGLLQTTDKAFVAPVVIALAGCYLVAQCLDGGFGGWPGRLANAAPVQYLGKISYGLYLYHAVAAWLIPDRPLGTGSSLEDLGIALLRTGAVVAIAASSWHLLEQPCNRLKSRFRLPS